MLPALKKIYTESKALALMRKTFGSFMDHSETLLGLWMEITILMITIFLYKLLGLIFPVFTAWFWLWISCLLYFFGNLWFSTKSNFKKKSQAKNLFYDFFWKYKKLYILKVYNLKSLEMRIHLWTTTTICAIYISITSKSFLLPSLFLISSLILW